jgi:Phage T4 tail fibre
MGKTLMKTQNTIITLALFLLATFSLQAQTLNPTVSIATAGSANTFKGGYTFAYATSGTPWNGALMSFGGFANQYDCQLSTNYSGSNISFRTKNGDAGTWNAWAELPTSRNLFSSISSNEGGNLSLQNPSKATLNAANEWKIYNMTGVYGNSLQFWAYGGNGFQSGAKMTLADNGNLGIGTTTPTAKLDVKGSIATESIAVKTFKVTNDGVYNSTLNSGDVAKINMGFDGAKGFVSFGAHTGNGFKDDILYLRGNDGNVGIGTTDPDAKLTVNGQIHTKEVRIDLLGALVPDYVFANDYKLKTLNEVDNYIKANSHLPEIPSATEMAKNGMLVSEMNLSLLKKIEELTLYAIEQQKKLEAMSERLSKLEKK